ncbi:MAG: SEC-C metal-binding domain-containing protein [Acidobacteriota bacterium]
MIADRDPDELERGNTLRRAEPSVHVGRNDPCPCGSKRKYKDAACEAVRLADAIVVFVRSRLS